MFKELNLNLLTIQKKIAHEDIYVPKNFFNYEIINLPLSDELKKKLNFFEFFKLGDLNSFPYRKLLKKFVNVKLNSQDLIIELYLFLNSPETFHSSLVLTDFEENIEDEDDGINNVLNKVIYISPENQDRRIDSLGVSVRLNNVLQILNIEKLGDLNGTIFRSVFETRNCGLKTIFELYDLINNFDRNGNSVRKEQVEILSGEIIHIPSYFKDLPLNFITKTKRIKNLVRQLKFKTLGDFHNVKFSQIKNMRRVDAKTISEFQAFIKTAKSNDFDQYLTENQSSSFKTKLLSKLDRQLNIPDEIREIEIDSVLLTPKLLKILRNFNIRTVGDLENFNYESLKAASGVGKESIFELWQFEMRMVKGAEDDTDLSAGSDFSFPEKVSFAGATLNDLLSYINTFINNLSERGREVLLHRFGGTTEETILTLEQLGENYQVTRERIRQIENKHLNRLKNDLDEISEIVFDDLSDKCRNAVCPLTSRFLIHLTNESYKLFQFPPNFYLRLFERITKDDHYIFLEGDDSLLNNQLTKKASEIAQNIKLILDETEGFMKLSEVFSRLSAFYVLENLNFADFFQAIRKKDFIIQQGDAADTLIISTDKNKLTMYDVARLVLRQSDCALRPKEIIRRAEEMFGLETDLPSARSLSNIPGYSDEFYLLDRKAIGLRQHFQLPEKEWTKVREDFFRLLTEKKRPISTSEVFSKNLFDWTNRTTTSETAEILRKDKRSKDLGRFLFALNCWEIEERESVKDIVIKVLREAGHPLKASEIGNRVEKYRSAFTTALTNLLNKQEEIKKYKFGYYGLNEWNDNFQEFFALNPKLLIRSVKKVGKTTFSELCNEFGIFYESETAHKMWRLLRSSDKLRFDPVFKSQQSKITYIV